MTRRALAILAATWAWSSGCTVDRDVELAIEGGAPGLVYELRVYEAASCVGVAERLTFESAATDGSVHAQTFRAGGGRAVGALAPEPHCFAVLARTETCAATAYGETAVDLADTGAVTVRLAPVSGSGGCAPSQACVAGECVSTPPTDGGPDAFVSCSTDGMTCEDATGETLMCCSGRCVPILDDPSNCGGCGIGCSDPSGADGTACCGGVCRDIRSDMANCGACGSRCESTCVGGMCGGSMRELLVALEPRGMTTDFSVDVTWFQWDGRDPDPMPEPGYTTGASIVDGGETIRIPLASIRPPGPPLYLCERSCTDESTCGCTDSSPETGGIALGYIEATDPERATLLGRAPVVVVYVSGADGFDPSRLAGLLGFMFGELPPPGISVHQPASDGLVAPVPLTEAIRLPVCDPPATDVCITEPVTRPYP